MNPSKNGWLADFLDYRKQHFVNNQGQSKTQLGQDPEHTFYGIVQPTGIMYGFPVQAISLLNSSQWSDRERVKVLLIDSLMNVAELYANEKIKDAEAFYDNMISSLASICEFYESVYPEISISTTNWYGKKKDTIVVAEQVLEKRVNMTTPSTNNFWLGFFHRNQLFIDVYIFGQWSHTERDQVLQEFFKSEKDELGYNAVKVMAAAAHANSHIEDEERELFNLFIESSGMPTEKKRVAKEYFEHGIGIQEIPIEEADPWVVRKFFLELALLTVWSDKKVEESEMQFLKDFNKSLGFSKDDLEKSMIAVEGFVLQNWAYLELLQDKKDYQKLSDEYISRLSSVAENYKNRLINDIKDDHELLSLIKTGNSETLTPEQKVIVKDKLVQILTMVPVFSVIALPEQFLTYNNVIRVFPKDVFSAINEL